MNQRSMAACAAVVALCGGLAAAAPVIDQIQSNTADFIAGFAQTDLAQSFQQANANVAGAGIFLEPGVGTPDTVTIELWDGLPNQGGSMFAGGSAAGTPGNWVDVFWSPVAVVPDTTLLLVFTSDNDTMGIAGSEANPYARGQAYANPGFVSFPTLDYAFRTYYDDASDVIPVPGALLLGGIGATLFGYLRRWRAV